MEVSDDFICEIAGSGKRTEDMRLEQQGAEGFEFLAILGFGVTDSGGQIGAIVVGAVGRWIGEIDEARKLVRQRLLVLLLGDGELLACGHSRIKP